MIKKLDIYLVKSFLGPFAITFFVVLFAFVMQNFWLYMDDLLGKGLGWGIILKYLFNFAITLTPLALPLGILLAAIMTFGNLGEHFELVAIKSAGISLIRFMQPLAIVVVILAIISFYFNNQIIPKANLRTYSLLYDVTNKKPALNIKEGIFNNTFDGFAIKVDEKGKDGQTIKGILIYDHTKSRGNKNVITASHGKMYPSPDKKYLIFELKDGWRHEESISPLERQHSKMHFKEWQMVFDLSKLAFKRTQQELFKNNEVMMNVVQLKTLIDSNNLKKEKEFVKAEQGISKYIAITNKQDNKKLSNAIDGKLTYKNSFLETVPDSIKPQVLIYLETHLRASKSHLFNPISEVVYNSQRQNKLLIEFHRKFTLAFACIVMFFIGAPLGSIIRKGGIGMPVVVGIIFFVIYFIISTSAEKLAKEDTLSPWLGMWMSAIILTPIAVIIMIQARNDSKYFSKETYIRILNKIKSKFNKSDTVG